MQNKKTVLICIILSFIILPLYSEEDKKSSLNFEMDLGLGTQTFNEENGPITYQTLNIQPELNIGKIGIGLDITFNFRFTDENGDFDLREADWIPVGETDAEKFQSFLSLYLPLFRYIKYGEKGGPLYAKIGSIEDGTIGNGFIFGNYANTNFLPNTRIVGLSFDLDGKLFNFPYLGIETFIGNLSLFDVLGVRLYTRPLNWLDVPIIKEMELGGSYATDTNPQAYYTFENSVNVKPVQMFGFDLFNPILSNDIVSLAAFGDIVFQPPVGEIRTATATGGMIGVGGKFFSFVPYGLQLRILGDDFVPVYFDSSYDLFREAKYEVVSGQSSIEGYAGWLASLGFSAFDDLFVFNASFDSPFSVDQSVENYLGHPHLRVILLVKEGFLPGFSFNAALDKKNIDKVTSWDNFWTQDMVIGAEINYDTGPAVLTLSYDLRYNPNAGEGEDPWETTAKLSSTFNIF